MSHHSDLIDTTEMYLRTVYELEEEGVVPLRARIAERLGQSGPTVSQTVARMERDGLLHVGRRPAPELTELGRHEAIGGHAQAPAGRAAARRCHRPGLGGPAHRGVPVGARDERRGRAPHRRAAGQAARVPARQPDPGTGPARSAVRGSTETGRAGQPHRRRLGRRRGRGRRRADQRAAAARRGARCTGCARPGCGPAARSTSPAPPAGVEVWLEDDAHRPLRPPDHATTSSFARVTSPSPPSRWWGAARARRLRSSRATDASPPRCPDMPVPSCEQGDHSVAHDPQGFLKYARASTRRSAPPSERVRDWQPIYLRAEAGGGRAEQAARCMDCGVAFCHSGCPLGNLIPEWNEFVARGDWASASERLHATNNFPEFTGWICPAPVRGRVCARAQHRPGDDQAGRAGHRRARVRRRARAAAAPAGAHRRRGRRGRLRAGRAGRRAATDPRRPRGHRLRARRPPRWPAALRHPGLQDAQGHHRPAGRADARRGHRVPAERRHRRRPTSRGCGPTSTRSSWPSARSPPASSTRPAGSCRGAPGDGLPAAGQPRAGRRHRTRRRSTRAAST